ncbi:single-stranded DNA-binding protein [Anaerotruncus rubiinfantis]|uniref:single-stranded DNA-binding protein n=1 Tax=Anaerotruncus rubiinfantis TaxID=1720200 RepID=UPI0011CCC5A0|nr:single-stranded DNA-binding protein [Anaerotruncus rubiinfantis]
MLNKTVMMGRLTDNPELRETATGVKVCTFSVAVERDYKVNGERKADFFNIVAWRGTAELICKYFKKGKPIILEGHFENRSYIGNDGNKRYVTELIVDQVNFAGDSAKKNEPPMPEPPPEPHAGQASPTPDAAPPTDGRDFAEMTANPDDLPF